MIKVASKIKNNKSRKLTIIIVIATVFFLSDIFFIGNIVYAAKWIQCGSQPLLQSHPNRLGFGYNTPASLVYTHPSIMREKTPLLGSSDSSLHCNMSTISQDYIPNDIKICENDSIAKAVEILDFKGEC